MCVVVAQTANDKTRTDLLKKMMDVDPMEPTEDEKTLGITKLRYYTVEFVPLLLRMCSLTSIFTYIFILYVYNS